jgi:DNA-binding NarL/FixJ family response regulator
MLEEITTHVLSSEPDLEIAETISTLAELPRRVARAGADVVLLGSNEAALAAELLEASPGLTVIAVAEEGQSAWLYAAGREPVSLGALSPSALVQAVRSSSERRAGGDRLDR